MKTLVINHRLGPVRITVCDKGTAYEIPTGMTGKELQKFQAKHETDIADLENDESDKPMQG